MRIVFAGTPEFAATALRALLAEATLEVVLVLTQPDRPAGRGLKTVPSPVKALALAQGVAVVTPASFSVKRDPVAAKATLDTLAAARADVLVVAAYGLILPQPVLDAPRGLADAGCGPVTAVNIHASLLPRWRGAAPVARAIEAGDDVTGITVMQMDSGLDTGCMLLAEAMPVAADDTTATLTDRLAGLGARLIVRALALGARGELRAVPQPAAGATYARKLDKGEAQLDFNQPAAQLALRVRAFDPFPVAGARLGATTLRFWRAHAEPGVRAAPGAVIATGEALRIACGEGVLAVTELQRAGSRRMSAAEFLAGTRVPVGSLLGGGSG